MRMDSLYFNKSHIAFREKARAFIAAEILPYVDDWEKEKTFPRELYLKTGRAGFLGLGYPEDYGGTPCDIFFEVIYTEEIIKCGSVGLASSLGSAAIGLPPIYALGTEAQKHKYIPPVLKGEKIAVLGVTEPSGGSDVANLRTKAVREGGDYVLNGEKTFITGGMRSDYFVVAARTGGEGLTGISLFLVEADAPGFSRQPLPRKMGWWCSDTASLFFDDCRVPVANILGPQDRGFLAVMQNFNHERFFMTAQCLGMMQACLDDAIAWARERKTFGKRLIEHQVIRHKLADMSARIDATRAVVQQIAWNINEGELPVAEISKAKFFASKGLEFCASEAMQILGGAGYLRGNRIERIYREVKVMAIGGGSEEILRDLAARQMGL